MTSPYGSQEKCAVAHMHRKVSPKSTFFIVAICTDDHISGDGAEAQTKGNFVHAVAMANNRPREVDASWGDRKLTYKNISEMRKK